MQMMHCSSGSSTGVLLPFEQAVVGVPPPGTGVDGGPDGELVISVAQLCTHV